MKRCSTSLLEITHVAFFTYQVDRDQEKFYQCLGEGCGKRHSHVLLMGA